MKTAAKVNNALKRIGIPSLVRDARSVCGGIIHGEEQSALSGQHSARKHLRLKGCGTIGMFRRAVGKHPQMIRCTDGPIAYAPGVSGESSSTASAGSLR